MATITILEALRNNVYTIDVLTGNFIYCTDSKEVFYDINDTVRLLIEPIILETEAERTAIVTPRNDTPYFILETELVYGYNETVWSILDSDTIKPFVQEFEELTPTTISVNGVNYAPRTLASQTFTSTGENVEDRLKSISRLGMTRIDVTATVDNQVEFEIPFPFENYMDDGNYFMIFAGSVLLNKYMYNVTDTTLTIIDPDYSIELDRDITFVFFFNTSVMTGNINYTKIDGNFIIDGTIPTIKLAKTSNSINTADITAVATSKAVKDLNDYLTQKLNIATIGNQISMVSTATSGDVLTASYPDFILTDMMSIFIRLNIDLLANATLSINEETPIPIYKDNAPVTADAGVAGDILNLVYNAYENRYYINSGNEVYKIISINGSKILTEDDSLTTIVIAIDTYNETFDTVKVYRNGIRLFEGINYSLSANNTITLIDLTAEVGDIFIFEIDRLSRI